MDNKTARKDRYNFGMDFLSMVPPFVEIQQAKVRPDSEYIEFVERVMPENRALWDENCSPPIEYLWHTQRRRRLKLRLVSIPTAWAMNRRYSIRFAYDPLMRILCVAAVYVDGKSLQGVPPICTDEEYRELCALYLEEELKDRVDDARRQTIKDFLVEVNVEKYLRQHLAGR